MDFQARLVAWTVCAILAETDAPPLWAWPQDGTFETVYAETDQFTDDILITNSLGGTALVQAKSRLTLGASEDSTIASVIKQFVQQYHRAPLGDLDRLVLAVGPETPAPVRTLVPHLTDLARGLPAGATVASASLSKAERGALRTLTAHIKREWKTATGRVATAGDVRSLLAKIRVSVHDLANGGASQLQAEGMLRTSILDTPSQASLVFGRIVADGLGYAGTGQVGARREDLQARLGELGVALRAAPSFRADIAKLRAHSQTVTQSLKRFASLPGEDGAMVAIPREAPKALSAVARGGSVLVTGDPGAGKSAVLHALAVAEAAAGKDVVVLAADMVSAHSLGALRDELGLAHELVDVLRGWPGPARGLLIIDAMDAARGEYAREALQELIGRVVGPESRWSVVASIRRFDLRYNERLKTLFQGLASGTPAEYRIPEFASIGHFNVPGLSDDELAELDTRAPRLAAAVAAASSELRMVVRTPFNLRLLAELVTLGVASAELAPIATQLQLLGTYWQHRVLGDGGDAREVVLRNTCEAMVSRRALRIPRSAVAPDVPSGHVLEELLRRQVVIEDETNGPPRRDAVSFAHHMLFDYAVARLLFNGDEGTLADRTRANSDLLLIVRPSYELHFRDLWERDATRVTFWSAALAMATAEGIPSIGRIVGPAVAAEALLAATDAAPLLAARQRGSDVDATLRHFIAARLADGPAGSSIPLARRAAWAKFAACLASTLDEPTAYHVRNLLIELCTSAPDRGQPMASVIGPAARELLTWSLACQRHHPYVIRTAIAAVALTGATDPAASEHLLREFLQPHRLPKYGYVEFPEIAARAGDLITVSPRLVSDLYKTAIAHEETSAEPTAMSSSVVMPLTSNRRQDFEHSHYELGLAFGRFLREAPDHAIDALSAMRLAESRRRHGDSDHGDPIVVDWDGDPVAIEPDGSYSWSTRDSHNLEDQTLRIFETWVAENSTTRTQARALLYLLRTQHRPVSIWRSVLRVAADHPGRLMPALTPLLASPQAFASAELGAAVCQVYRAAYATFPQATRRRIERAIMTLPAIYADARETDPGRLRERGEAVRDRVLACLPDTAVLTTAARARLAELRASGIHDPGDSEADSDGWTSRTFDERDELRELGVDVDAPANVEIQKLTAAVAAFASEHLNSVPSRDEIAAIMPALRVLWDAISAAAAAGAEKQQADRSWGHAADAAAAVARAETLAEDRSAASLVTNILLKSARHPKPGPREDPGAFDAAPSWGSAEPRIEAAQGLPLLARRPDLCTAQVIAAIDDLSRDPAPVVRFHVAQRLALLRQSAPEAMWAIATRLLNDPSTAVVDVLVAALPGIVADNVEALPELLRIAFDRAGDGPGSDRLRRHCAQAMVGVYVFRGLEEAGVLVDEVIVSRLSEAPDVAERVVHLLREAFVYGDPTEPNSGAAEIRRRALDLALELLNGALNAMEAWESQLRDAQIDEADPRHAVIKATVHIIYGVATQVYFATGAFDEKQGKDDGSTPAQRERLYREASSLLDRLASVKYAAPAHHVLEALEAFIDYDPRGVFLLIARTIQAAQASGYQGDSLAAGLVVKLVERYLAEHPALLQQDDECRRALVQTLDLFVDAGWGEAMRLTYRLQDIYR